MAGPLFRELAEDLSIHFLLQSELFTGHPDTLNLDSFSTKLKIVAAPVYNRRSKTTRIFSWINYTVLSFFKLFFCPKNTLIFVVSNPPLIGIVVWLLNKIRNIEYIVLVYDIHPDTLIASGLLKEKSVISKLWRKINKAVWENSIAVYTIGDVMGERLARNFDPSKTILKKVGVIPPWADTDLIQPLNKNDNPLAVSLNQQNYITVLYSGNMGISHDIESILEAAKLLKEHKKIRFLFIGEGHKWKTAFDFVKVNNLSSVQVLPFQPEENFPFTLALGDISLVTLNIGVESLMVPSKLYYYMAAGSAIIGICKGDNDLRRSLQKVNAGIIVDPQNPVELANNILKLANDEDLLFQYKLNARTGSVNFYSRKICMNNFLKSLREIGLI